MYQIPRQTAATRLQSTCAEGEARPADGTSLELFGGELRRGFTPLDESEWREIYYSHAGGGASELNGRYLYYRAGYWYVGHDVTSDVVWARDDGRWSSVRCVPGALALSVWVLQRCEEWG